LKKNIPIVVRILLCAVAEFLLFWFQLPAINIRNRSFWEFIVESIIICTIIIAISSVVGFFKNNKNKQGKEILVDGKAIIKNSKKPFKVWLAVVIILIVAPFVMDIIGSKVFNARLILTLYKYQREISQRTFPSLKCHKFLLLTETWHHDLEKESSVR